MRVFIAGIMQGSRLDKDVVSQSYRTTIAQAIRARIPDVEIIDPWSLHPQSPSYDDTQGKQVFLGFNQAAATADVLVAYVPEASMGTAIEIWQAFQAGARVYTISPMADNWVIKFLSNRVLPTLQDFNQFVSSGEFERSLQQPASS